MADEHLKTCNEWLLTDGLGGYAMGNADGINTRRYHAVWMPSAAPPTRRLVGLRLVIDELRLDSGETVSLASAHFGPASTIHPSGVEQLIDTHIDNRHVCWRYALPHGGIIERSLHLDANGARLSWTLSGANATLIVRPLLTLRDAHHLLARPTNDIDIERTDTALIAMHDGTKVQFVLSHGRWGDDAPDWWLDLRYPMEANRGYDDTEAALAPGAAEVPIGDGDTCSMTCSLSTQPVPPPPEQPSGAALHAAAEQFIVTRPTNIATGGLSIIAGYPWFADWGRDAMISLPGLLLTTDRFTEAKRVLETFAESMRNGLIPNRFDDTESIAHYDTADASLWFVHAVVAWMDASGDRDAALLDAAMNIVEHYLHGTDFGIGIRNGLVEAGQEGYALTWMDAKTDGVAITPRVGRPIELSALWYDALLQLAGHIPASAATLRAHANTTAQAFDAFWNNDAKCCFDVLGDSPDASIRPNQLFACSLQHSPLTQSQRRSVLQVVGNDLLTPFGLRTLAPSDPRYHGSCTGTQTQRDKAYHNGTVWPWLIGTWLDAKALLKEPACVPKGLLNSMHSGCTGQLAEIFDGEAPHTPRGCPAQAWSVAEVLRHV